MFLFDFFLFFSIKASKQPNVLIKADKKNFITEKTWIVHVKDNYKNWNPCNNSNNDLVLLIDRVINCVCTLLQHSIMGQLGYYDNFLKIVRGIMSLGKILLID
jgi:hypothetical protein